MTVAERLVLARGNTTRKEVCQALKISRSALAMYENGNRVPRDETKIRMAKLYGTTVEALLY
jgi:transcriptional regulator with XRE-family HTH domain